MSNRLDRLLHSYQRHIAIPWQKGLAGKQKVLFAVYDKHDELKLQARLTEFETATVSAGHKWRHQDLSNRFPQWMASLKYRDDYFACPEDFRTRLKKFLPDMAKEINEELASEQCDETTVLGLSGIGSLFGLARVSGLVDELAPHIRGRLLVFFPGEYENNNYRLLDARDGWNYMAVPLTCSDNF